MVTNRLSHTVGQWFSTSTKFVNLTEGIFFEILHTSLMLVFIAGTNILKSYQHEAGSKQALKMESTRSSETLVDFQRTTRRYIPEDGTFYNHRCENVKSYKCIA
jgi:hypothetical protein